MNLDSGRLSFVGDGMMDNLHRSAKYYQDLALRTADAEDLVTQLESDIARARDALENSLRGYDSFDTLAFLRNFQGPWDFSGVQESNSLIENSQSAQDVIALALLGMGLPRSPLTGRNSGQPNPQVVMGRAADIVVAARTLAVWQGKSLNQPLGALAGEFLAYELSVRGRQYDSAAAELNSELLNDPMIATVLKSVLGFTLDDIRTVRDASTGLMNERFFGARDRVYEAKRSGAGQGGESGSQDMNIMVNECRLFGAVSVADVAEQTRIDESTVRAVLEFFSATRPAADDPDPILRFATGERPAPWGCIVDEDEALILNGFLGEDELRRDIERGLIDAATANPKIAGKSWSKYDKQRAAYSESRAAETLEKLLNGCEPRWEGQKYVGPIEIDETAILHSGAELSSIQTRTREFESDLLFVADGVALCVEVKAGSISGKSRSGNAKRLATDLLKTLKEGNEQADRLTKLIENNKGVWGGNGEWIDLASVCEVHSIVVMLDDMGPLSISMNELALRGIISTSEVPWIVSMHDLIVIERTVDHPAQFLEYLRRRRSRRLATMVNGVDELDMFMWFLNGGLYFDPDPREVAAQIPTDMPINASALMRYEKQSRVRLGTLTDPLDAWFYSQEGLSSTISSKPTREEQPWVEQFLAASESAHSPGWLRFGADLVGLSEKAQREIGKGLKEQCRRARGGGIERSLTTHSTTAHGSWLLTVSAVPDGAPTEHLPKYMDEKQYQTRSSRSMLLLYQTDGSLTDSRYRGEPQNRTAEQDQAIQVSPLRSLAATFSQLPPSARRSTKRLNGNRGKKNRKRG